MELFGLGADPKFCGYEGADLQQEKFLLLYRVENS